MGRQTKKPQKKNLLMGSQTKKPQKKNLLMGRQVMPAQKKKQQTKNRQAGKECMRKRRARRLQMKNPMT